MKYAFPLFLGVVFAAAFARAEGPLDPPVTALSGGTPVPSMKTLQEIWDKIGELESQVVRLETQITALQAGGPGPAFPMPFVDVLNAPNFGDTGGSPVPAGAVNYNYKIGKYEVTNTQYATFLNAVAATDTNNLYHANMGSTERGGISRSGSSGNYTYAVKPAMGDKPVNYVSWFDAVRFCNWLHNGQPSGAQGAGTTEGGAYTLTGGTSIAAGTDPNHGANGRNAGAKFHLPSENEWYKAAYYQHSSQGGDSDDYWLYPTGSNTAPTVATADATGNVNNDAENIANHGSGAKWNGQNGNVTTVGSGGAGSESFCGAADMAGNVWEWNEEVISGSRGARGGTFNDAEILMRSTYRASPNPTIDYLDIGFRVAAP